MPPEACSSTRQRRNNYSPDVDTEQRLLERIHQGDRKAHRELYDRLAGTAMAVALRYVGNQEAARDVLQESFVKILTHIGSFTYRGEGSLRAWAMRLVSNEALNWLKKQQHFQADDDLPEDLSEEEEPDVGQIPMEELQRMIQQLPDGYRAVFCLYVFEQKSHKEIAQLLGIRENSSASQYLRARRMLARSINNYQRQQQL